MLRKGKVILKHEEMSLKDAQIILNKEEIII